MELEKFLEKSLKANKSTRLLGIYTKGSQVFIAINKSFYEVVTVRKDPDLEHFNTDKLEIHSAHNFYGSLDRVVLSIGDKYSDKTNYFYSMKQYILQTDKGVGKLVLKWKHTGMGECCLALVKTKAPNGLENVACEVGFEPTNLLAV